MPLTKSRIGHPRDTVNGKIRPSDGNEKMEDRAVRQRAHLTPTYSETFNRRSKAGGEYTTPHREHNPESPRYLQGDMLPIPLLRRDSANDPTAYGSQLGGMNLTSQSIPDTQKQLNTTNPGDLPRAGIIGLVVGSGVALVFVLVLATWFPAMMRKRAAKKAVRNGVDVEMLEFEATSQRR